MNDNVNSLLKIKIDLLIGSALEKQIFSACSLGFFKIDNEKLHREIYYYGKTGVGVKTKTVCKDTFFDLASLTKPLVTSMVILHLLNKGLLKFEDKLNKFFKNINADKETIKLYHLLSHSSGLPAHKPYFLELIKIPFSERQKHLEKLIFSEKLCFYPGTKVLYSDLGYMLLGFIIEIITGETIDVFWERNILQPLKLKNEILFTNKTISNQSSYVETGKCLWSKKTLQGLVNDDNCRALGGVS